MAALSWYTTPRKVHDENHFHFHPILEVAAVFAGIFVTMIPALEILRTHVAQVFADIAPGLGLCGDDAALATGALATFFPAQFTGTCARNTTGRTVDDNA